MCAGKSKLTISLVLLTAILLAPNTLAAQELRGSATGEWSNLNTVAGGSKLAVKLKSGKTVNGKLSSVSDSALSLTVKEKPVELKREDVQSVYVVTKKSATKATLIGMGIGAGAGLGIGLAGSKDDDFANLDRNITYGLTVLGAVAGGIAGFVIGKSGGKRVLIYEAK